MDTFITLWERAPIWRLTFIATASITAIAFLLRPTPPTPTGLAKYTPPAPQSSPSNLTRSSQTLASSKLITNHSQTAIIINQNKRHDSNFDGQLIQIKNKRFASNTELHVIGVYEANNPTEKTERQKCIALRKDIPAMMACTAQFNHRMNPIKVHIPPSTKPIVLVLMAYEPVRWEISASAASNIQEVFISGYHGQDIIGIDQAIPISSYSYEASPCKNCTRKADYFYAYDENSQNYIDAIKKISSITGLTPNSFQGSYKGEQFYIRPGSTSTSTTSNLYQFKDIYTGHSFTNTIKIANSTISLPEGKWNAISYYNKGNDRNQDQTLLLQSSGGNLAQSFFAIRVKTLEDQSGFPANDGCKRKSDYINEAPSNIAFGNQLCYWVGPIDDPWSQPLFTAAQTRLAGYIPDIVIASSFHQANQRVAIDTLLYTLPDEKILQKLPRGIQSWEPQNINKNPEILSFIEEQKQWAKFWFQIMSATR